MLTDSAGNKSHLSLSKHPLVGHKVRPAIAKDSPKRPGSEGVKSPSQNPGQSPSLASFEQDWKHQGPEDSDFRPPAHVPTAPHSMIQLIQDSPGPTQMSIDLWLTASGDMNITAKLGESLCDLNILP